MKNIFKIFTGVALCALFVTSCNVENQKSTYSPVQANEASFAQSVVSDTEIDAKAVTFAVKVVRNSAKDALSLNIDGSGLPEGVKAPATVAFAAGEYQADLKLDVSAMEVGKTYSGTVSLKDSTQYNKNIAITSCSVKLAKAYTWVEIGTGEYFDCVYHGFGEVEGSRVIIKPTILKAEGFDRYRIVEPFVKKDLIAAWGDDYYAGNQSAYIEFWATGEGKQIKYNSPIYTGVSVIDLGTNCYTTYYLPSDYSASYAARDKYNCYLADNVIRFYAVANIENSGGYWFGMALNYLMIPGGSVKDLAKWLDENDL